MSSTSDLQKTLLQQKQQMADYAMAIDLMAQIAKSDSEDVVIEKILEFFQILFSPQKINYLAVKEGSPDRLSYRCASPEDEETVENRLTAYRFDSPWLELPEGFVIKNISHGETYGIVEVDGIEFVDYKRQYLNLAASMAPVFGLAVENARRYGELLAAREVLEQKNQSLQKALEEVKTLSGLLPICMHCKKIRDDKGYWNQLERYIHDHSEARFSHGICNECVVKYHSY